MTSDLAGWKDPLSADGEQPARCRQSELVLAGEEELVRLVVGLETDVSRVVLQGPLAGLGAFSLAVKARFEIVDAQKKVVADGLVGGEPVSVLPGEYTVRVKGRSLSVTVQPKKTSDVSL